jgi:hypothetical protein
MRTRSIAALATAAMLSAAPLLAPPANAAPAGGPHWHAVQVRPPAGGAYGLLSAIACTSAAHCVAGGNYFTAAKTTAPMIAADSAGHWARARTLRLPSGAAHAFQAATVAGLACPGSRSCVAVGNYTTAAGPLAGFIAAGHGGNWSRARQVLLPKDAVAAAAFLTGVSCTGTRSCTAVGGYSNAAGDQAMAAAGSAGHWQRAVAIKPPSNAAADPDAHLSAVSCTGPGDCVAVGAYENKALDDEGLAVIERHGRWGRGTQIPLPHNAPGDPQAEFYSVSCQPRHACVAVGSYGPGSVLTGVAATESGGHWQRGVELNALPGNAKTNAASGLEAVSCHASGCVAAGYYTHKGGGLAIMALTRTGHTWHRAMQLALPAHAGPTASQVAELFGVACTKHGSCTAVGTYTTSSDIPEALATRN